jgi:topoisomerase-4 subunit A
MTAKKKNTKDDDEAILNEESPVPNEDAKIENDGNNSPPKISTAKTAENTHLRKIVESNYMEYASYVIKDRAIPDINDGLKPVQRRILWSLRRVDDGRFNKVANIVGHCMQFHPHGDQSIYGSLVVLANTEYFIEKQGNFGNIFTGDQASAARYIECRLTELAKETLFNTDITEFTESYDGRNKEPVYLPAKIPSVLMLGHEGIAPGMTTRIFPHNFGELLEAQIAILKNEPFKLYPDFLQAGIMDVSDYQDGAGKITLRAKIDIDGRNLVIREIPATTTTESLIASIEKAANANKIKIASINDFTAGKVEIEIIPQRGYDPEKALNALYAYTDCSVTVSSNILVINENRPEIMTVTQVLRHCTERLVEYLRRELEIETGKLKERLHEKTLAQIFIENRIYKRIEECESYELVISEVRKGLEKFKKLFIRNLTVEDIEKLLAIPIKRISLFDINKNKQDIDDIVRAIQEAEKNLKRIKNFTIKYISGLIDKFAKRFGRKTKIESFERIDVKQVALNNIKVGWDRKNCLVGTDIKNDETITCNEYDRILCVEKSGKYKLVAIPGKLFVDKLFYLCKHDKNTVFNILYKDKTTGAYYAKRTVISKFITDKEYGVCPPSCSLQLFNTKQGSIYECIFEPAPRQKHKSIILDFEQQPMRTPKSKGVKLTNKKITDFKFIGTAEPQDEKSEPVQGGTNNDESAKIAKPQPSPSPALADAAPPAIQPAPAPAKPAKIAKEKTKSEKRQKDSKKNDDDDWGVSQPDLGF